MKRAILVFTLVVGVLAASSASAQSDLGLKNVGFAVSVVSPEDLDATFGFGVFANHGTIAPKFNLESRLDYWGWSDRRAGVESKVSDVVLGARTKYNFETTNPKVRPFAGFGLGVHFLNGEVDFPAGGGNPATKVKTSDTKLGLDLGGGITTAMSPRADFVGEAWYGIVSDANQFSMRAGVSFKLGK